MISFLFVILLLIKALATNFAAAKHPRGDTENTQEVGAILVETTFWLFFFIVFRYEISKILYEFLDELVVPAPNLKKIVYLQ